MTVPSQILALVAALAFLFPVELAAAEASPWSQAEQARVRLVPGPVSADGTRRIGVHIEMAPGWHTYWRHPGASGVPPRFDWEGSGNLAGADVLWPAPKRIRDPYGVSYGYEDEVVFPVVVRPERSGKGVSVRLALDYAVCMDVCIPEFAELEIELAPDTALRPVYARLVEDFEARVPGPATSTSLPRLESTWIELLDGAPALVVDAAMAPDSRGAELFVEGPEEFYFVAPDGPEVLPGGRGRFVVRIMGAEQASDLDGARLGATLVDGDSAVESWWTVR